MKRKILNCLKNLEKSEEIKILYAVESGSRAWGFASQDSDYDIRFFYIHKPDWYLSILKKPDTIELVKDGILDIAGWDFRKTLLLFLKSNPPLFEWLRSPIVYLKQTNSIQEMQDISAIYFNNKSSMYHYLNMAKGNYREYLKGDTVWIKKYFYVLRPILACEWIKDKKSIPPIEFKVLFETQIKNKLIKIEIEKLLKMKVEGDELRKDNKIKIINDYIEDRFVFFEKYLKNILSPGTQGLQELDQLFRKILKDTWRKN